MDNVDTLEKAMEEGCKVQPFVESVNVRIDRSRLKVKRGEFDYVSLTGDMLEVDLTVRYQTARVVARMQLVKEMGYPLMFVRRIERA